MKIVKPSFTIETVVDGDKILKDLELCGRVCYKSEERITEDSAKKFVKSILNNDHLSVIEHETVRVRFTCDRGVSHEIVRHRIGSYSQESTRYCNYKSKGIKVIKPFFFLKNSAKYNVWKTVMTICDWGYSMLISLGAKPEEARTVLPQSVKTEIVVTYNLREWRHFFSERCSKSAHPQMRELTIPLLKEFQKRIPIIFDDIIPSE